jgi:dihydroxy-acid dehydratase
LFILRGTLAPGGAVGKASGVSKAMWRTTLKAGVVENEDACIEARRDGSVRPGAVSDENQLWGIRPGVVGIAK